MEVGKQIKYSELNTLMSIGFNVIENKNSLVLSGMVTDKIEAIVISKITPLWSNILSHYFNINIKHVQW